MKTQEAETKALDYFNCGFHCAESMAKTIVELYAAEPNNDIVKVASGFGGGIGGTHEDVCGALAGGIIAIGYLYGRTEPGKDISISTDLAGEFRMRFVEEFGSTNCGLILDRLGQQENGNKCKRLTATAAGWLSELLGEMEE